LLLPPAWQPDRLLGVHIPGLGVLMAVVIVLLTGVLAANIIGERLLRWGEGLLNRIPVVRSIYSGVKQVSDTLFSNKGQSFRKVVLIQFPHPGTWTLGFVVGAPGPVVSAHTTSGAITVYVPTAPNPTSGYVLVVRPEDVEELDISVDDALKFHLSMGVVAPGSNGRIQRSALTTEGPGVPG
jgi:uncharacterized membrane protein